MFGSLLGILSGPESRAKTKPRTPVVRISEAAGDDSLTLSLLARGYDR